MVDHGLDPHTVLLALLQQLGTSLLLLLAWTDYGSILLGPWLDRVGPGVPSVDIIVIARGGVLFLNLLLLLAKTLPRLPGDIAIVGAVCNTRQRL